MAPRIDRPPIVDKVSDAAVAELPTWTPAIGGRRLDFEFLNACPDGRRYVSTLLDWQAGKRGALTPAQDVRTFLKFASARPWPPGTETLSQYRDQLSSSTTISDNTRQQYYSNVTAYFRRLINDGVVRDQSVPEGFKDVQGETTPTLTEQAAGWREWFKTSPVYDAWMANAPIADLDVISREVLAVSEGWIRTLETEAAKDVERRFEDWAIAERLLRSGTSADLPAQRWPQNRSIEMALCALYTKFGLLLPTSEKWPDDLIGFLKSRGWSVDRTRAALFPTIKSLDAILVLMLCNRTLQPNVDSALFYSFIGCVSDTESAGQVRVRLGKFRGAGVNAVLDRNLPVVKALQALEQKLTLCISLLPPLPKALSSDGGVPLFIPCSRPDQAGPSVVDPGTAADMVRRFIRKAAVSNEVLKPLVGAVTGENFRPTHLLCRHLRRESIFKIQASAGHSRPETSADYLRRVAVEADLRARQLEFQARFLADAKATRMRRLGNGFLCEPDDRGREGCLRTDLCGMGPDGCSARRIFLENPELVAEWIAMSDHIRNNEHYLRIHRPESWKERWLPRLMEYESLLERASESVVQKAQAHVSQVSLMPLE